MKFQCALVVVLFGIFCIGCSSDKTKANMQGDPATATTNDSVRSSNEFLTRLEAADLLDGKQDHVIGKCYVCELGMNGSEKFSVNVQGFTAHLCSKSCKQEFETSTEKIVLNTNVPAATK